MTRIDGGMPLVEQDGETYDKIRQILLRKKLWEASLLQAQAAREKEEANKNQEEKSNNESATDITEDGAAVEEVDARTESEIMKDNAAAKQEELTQRANELREELNKLIQQRTELQMEAERQLKIIEEHELKLLLEEMEEMDKLRREHETEMQMLVEKMEDDNKKDEDELKSELKKIAEEAARKRQKLITSSAAGDRDVDGSAVTEVGKKKSVEKEEELKVCCWGGGRLGKPLAVLRLSCISLCV